MWPRSSPKRSIHSPRTRFCTGSAQGFGPRPPPHGVLRGIDRPIYLVDREESTFHATRHFGGAKSAASKMHNKSFSHLMSKLKLYPAAARTALLASPLRWAR